MRFIQVGGQSDRAWTIFLEKNLSTLGEVIRVEVDTMGRTSDGPDDVWIIDATFEDKVEELVTALRNERPERRIIVMTASPTWARARAAFQAGAIDYLPKTISGPELFAAIDEIKKRPLPPWPR